MKITHLDHLVLTVADIDATVRFYKLLGMEKIVFGQGRIAMRFGNQKLNLHEMGKEIKPHARQPQPGSADLCFIIDTPIAEVIELLEGKIEIEIGPVDRTGATGPITSIYIRDPDHNLIELSNYKK